MKYIGLFIVLFFLVQTSCYRKMVSSREMVIGENDNQLEVEINRLNTIAQLLSGSRYTELDYLYDKELIVSNNTREKVKILNEKSHNLAFHLLDLETSIRIDDEIISYNLTGNYNFLNASAANNITLIATDYRDEFTNKSFSEIRAQAIQRREKNKNILSGRGSRGNQVFEIDFLLKFKNDVIGDLSKVKSLNNNKRTLISRLARVELELLRLDSTYADISAFSYFIDTKITEETFDYNEMDFYSLSDYLMYSFRRTNKKVLYELSIKTLLKPYSLIKSAKNRLFYSNYINSVIDEIIQHSFSTEAFVELVYYTSLNKSRLIVEELVMNKSVSDEGIEDYFEKIFISKTSFKEDVSKIDGYIDFYFFSSNENANKNNSSLYAVTNSSPPSPTRGFKRVSEVKEGELYRGSNLLISYIQNGIVSVKRITGKEFDSFKNNLDIFYNEISTTPSSSGSTQNLFEQCKEYFQNDNINIDADEVVLSLDKWLNRYPIELFFDSQTTRTLNLSTYRNSKSKLQGINILGFFDPNNDLPGARLEYDILSNMNLSSHLFKSGDVSKENFAKPYNFNVLHLSMHGIFNNDEPEKSKMILNNGVLDLSTQDPNSIYANEFQNYDIFENNDLIFLAACESGVTRSSSNNRKEIQGIVRPLIILNNKHLVLTLWNIDDQATKDFVSKFYNRLNESNDIESSFFEAKGHIKEVYKSYYYYSPFYLIKIK